MRRSLGTKPNSSQFQPKRMRQSNEGPGLSQPQAAASSRPSRSSGVRDSGMSSGKRVSSMSRLPKPQTSTAKRSSSSGANRGQPLGERNRNSNMVTPSSNRNWSKKDLITPQGKVSTVQRLSIAPQSQSRMSMGSTASKRMSGRGSQMGMRVLKDSRPLTDKAYQTEQTRKILDFLRLNEYPNTILTSKHFPLSAKEFVSIFNFMYCFLDPQNPSKLPTVKYEEDVLKVFKSLNYPGNLTKSNFAAMGSLHSWPTVLGSLSYLCDLVKIYSEKLLPRDNFNAMAFPSVDDDGLPTDRTNKNKIQLEYFLSCFMKWNEGTDDLTEMDFDDEMKRLGEDLMENQNVNIEYLKELESSMKRFKKEAEALSSQGSSYQALEEQMSAQAADVAKLEEYISKLQSNVEAKRVDLDKIPTEQDVLNEKYQSMRKEIQELRSKCENPNVNPREAEKNSILINERRRLIDNLKIECDGVDNKNWEMEVKFSKMRESIDSTTRQINSKSLEANIKTKDGGIFKMEEFRLGNYHQYDEIKIELVEAVKVAKNDQRLLEKEVSKGESLIEESKDKLVSLKKSLDDKKFEMSRITEEISRSKDKISVDEKKLDSRLIEVRDQLLQVKSKERAGAGELSKELEVVEARLEAAKVKRKTEFEAGQMFLKKVIGQTLDYFEECDRIEKNKSDNLVEQIQKKIAEVRLTAKEIEEKCDKYV